MSHKQKTAQPPDQLTPITSSYRLLHSLTTRRATRAAQMKNAAQCELGGILAEAVLRPAMAADYLLAAGADAAGAGVDAAGALAALTALAFL